MEKLTIPKDLCLWSKDVEVYISKDKIEKERWLLLKNYLGYNVYYVYNPEECVGNCIYPYLFLGCHYIMRHIDRLVGNKKDYPGLERYARKYCIEI